MAHGVYSNITNTGANHGHQDPSQIFRTMDGNRAQEIREAYYKTVEGLMTLARELELADADLADSPTPEAPPGERAL